MTRPRSRRNVEGLAGFSVIDPGGNWIRIFPVAEPVSEPGTAAPETKLARALEDAVVLAGSRGDLAQTAKILDGALGRDPDAPIVDRGRPSPTGWSWPSLRRTPPGPQSWCPHWTELP